MAIGSAATKRKCPTRFRCSRKVTELIEKTRNDLTIYDAVAANWWSDDIRWVRTLKNLVPGRLSWFDRHIDWTGKDLLDLGCAGGFMAEALAARGARVTGIDPAEKGQDKVNDDGGQCNDRHINKKVKPVRGKCFGRDGHEGEGTQHGCKNAASRSPPGNALASPEKILGAFIPEGKEHTYAYQDHQVDNDGADIDPAKAGRRPQRCDPPDKW